MSTRIVHAAFVLLGLLALLVPAAGLSLAKGPADKVTIDGPGLTSEIEVTETVLLSALSIGQLEDFGRPSATPRDPGPGYELTRYFKDRAGFQAFDRVRYYPNAAGGGGYIFYEGIVNGWSEYDGRWFRASVAGDQVMRRLLAENGVRLDRALPPSFAARDLAELVELRASPPWPGRSSEPAPPAGNGGGSFEASVLLKRGDWLYPVDPRTGQGVPGYAPVRFGSNWDKYTLSPDGKMLAAAVFRKRREGALHLIDLRTWRDSRMPLKIDNWVNAITFSRDGTRLAVAAARPVERGQRWPGTYSLAILDVVEGTLLAQKEVDFDPRLLEFTPGAAALMVFSVSRDPETGWNTQPPRAVLLNATDLRTEWDVTLPGVVAGQFLEKSGDGAETAVSWSPAAVFSSEAQTLYLVHADADRLTTVDFLARTVRSVEVRPEQSWLDRLLALTAGVAYAKGPYSGAVKRAVIGPSGDGDRLYVIGQGYDEDEPLALTPLGLQVIDVTNSAEVARLETEATEIRLSPDGEQLYLSGWSQSGQPGVLPTPWTEILETHDLQAIAYLDKQHAVPARRLDGRPILLSSYVRRGRTVLSTLDPEAFEVIHAWSVAGDATWLASP